MSDSLSTTWKAGAESGAGGWSRSTVTNEGGYMTTMLLACKLYESGKSEIKADEIKEEQGTPSIR